MRYWKIHWLLSKQALPQNNISKQEDNFNYEKRTNAIGQQVLEDLWRQRADGEAEGLQVIYVRFGGGANVRVCVVAGHLEAQTAVVFVAIFKRIGRNHDFTTTKYGDPTNPLRLRLINLFFQITFISHPQNLY